MTFKLKQPVGLEYNHDLDDVSRTKKALSSLGYFETPKYGMTKFPDMPLFEGVKSFQRSRGLRDDGVMKPGGPTARELGKELAGRGWAAKPLGIAEGEWDWMDKQFDHPNIDVPAKRRPTQSIFGTFGDVGWGRRNDPRDILAARRALAWAGHLPGEKARDQKSPDNDLFKAIHNFQSAAGVKSDGWIGSGGETAEALDEAIAPKVQAYLKSSVGNEIGGKDGRQNKGVEVAGAPALLLQQFMKLALPGVAAGVAGQKAVEETIKWKGANEPENRTDMADPPPVIPPSEPQNELGPIKTESPAKSPIAEMDLSNPIPEDIEPGIYVHPMPPEEMVQWGQIVENKGNEATRKELERIRDFYEGLGWKHVAGGRYSEKNEKIGKRGIKPGDE